ncbi:MAG TPA: hypothetical protein VK646_07975 [Actinomycetota bacterium]|nr:hypothetical protein [Actinomycetota bacterium]
MFLVPLVAAVIAGAFAFLLAKEFAAKRRPYTLLWAIAMVCFAVASAMVMLGVLGGWTEREFAVYWALGAVLNVPFLAAGEIVLLFRQRWALWGSWLVLVFSAAYTTTVLRAADMNAVALADRLPSGKDVFGAGTAAQHLPQIFSYPAYFILVAGALWSAWRMRGHPELRDRFVGTLLIAVGATIVAGGATFAAFGLLVGFIITLVAGIAVMFGGFLRASRRAPAPAPA